MPLPKRWNMLFTLTLAFFTLDLDALNQRLLFLGHDGLPLIAAQSLQPLAHAAAQHEQRNNCDDGPECKRSEYGYQ